MNHRPLLAALLVAAAAVLAGAQPSSAESGHGRHANVVFVQTNELNGNRIVVFDRGADGRLSQAGVYPTGGLGGAAAPGTESDRLASQDSLVYDEADRVLLAVNAGSDTVSTFRVRGDRLRLLDVEPSGGQFPASIAVHDGLVYVLNAGGAGTVQGFRLSRHGLTPISASARSLGLANGDPPNFLTSPGQVGFAPDGSKLLVTTKASTSAIDVFAVGSDGRLSAAPVVNPSATPVPFAFTFAPSGRLVAGEAGASSVTTYALQAGGTLSDPRSQSDGQAALCWILRVGGFYYVSNTGSNTLSSFEVAASGQPSLLHAVAATTNPGPIDLASSGAFLYAQTGTNGTVDEFHVAPNGSLERSARSRVCRLGSRASLLRRSYCRRGPSTPGPRLLFPPFQPRWPESSWRTRPRIAAYLAGFSVPRRASVGFQYAARAAGEELSGARWSATNEPCERATFSSICWPGKPALRRRSSSRPAPSEACGSASLTSTARIVLGRIGRRSTICACSP
jgi:6-phosphogluconolactonase (cycloisomerase 2 family)